MFTILAMTGMRAGEMLGLQWDDIDFAAGCIHIRRSAWYGKIQTTKSKSSTAPVHLPESLAATLRAYRERWKPNPQGFLFVTRNNRPPSSNKVVQYGLWPVLDALKISRCGLHAFRHTHASLLLHTGATPNAAKPLNLLVHCGRLASNSVQPRSYFLHRFPVRVAYDMPVNL